MSTTWSIFTRDLGRLARTPKVWVTLIGLMFIPGLYSWFNVAAFWDPYGNVDHIRVAVTNEDTGATSELTGPLDVGDQLEQQLRDNDQLGWEFLSADEAEEALKKGDVFASITIPEHFTSDILSMFQGTYSEPQLVYRVNEKTSAIAPKITDQGATIIDGAINTVFKAQVAEAVTDQLRQAGADVQGRLTSAGENSANGFADAAQSVAGAQESLSRVQASITAADPTVAATQDTLRSVDETLGNARTSLSQVQDIMTEVQAQVASLSDATTNAYLQGTTALADGVAEANSSVTSATGEIRRAGNGVDTALREANGVVRQGDQAIAQLKRLSSGAPLSPDVQAQVTGAIDGLKERNATNQQLVDDLTALKGNAAGTLDSVNRAGDALQDATAATRDQAQDLRTALGQTLPALNQAINQVNSSAGNFSGALASQQTLLRESVSLLDGVRTQLQATNGVLENFKGDLSGIQQGMQTAETDLRTLVASSGDGVLGTVTNLDSVGISKFLASPAVAEPHTVYPVNTYGSGMAALFTNLSLWIGAFMLMVVFRTEVDTEKLRRVTVPQAYLGRLMLMAIFTFGQGIVVSVGNMILGVQMVNPLIFIASSIVIGLCYLSIVYALVVALGHVGRGIAVVLAFLQIPGSSGMYPIEMTPGFFQAISPFLPFTYGIDALRENIGGFYGTNYLKAMGTLIIMASVAFIVGTLLRRGMSNVKMLYHSQFAEGGLLTNEDVQVVGTSYRLTDMIHALRDRENFREELDNRWKLLREHHRGLLITIWSAGGVGILICGVVALLIPDQRTLLFGLACLWFLLFVTAVSFIEYARQSFAHAYELADLPDEELREVASVQGSRLGSQISAPTGRHHRGES